MKEKNEALAEKTPLLARPVAAVLLTMIPCILWGSAFPCVKIGYTLFGIAGAGIPSLWVYAGIRFLLAGILLIGFASIMGKRLMTPRSKTSWKHVGVICLFETVLQYTFYYIGLARLAAMKVSILNGATAIILILFSALIFRQEKLTGRKLIAGLIGFAGIVLMNLGGTFGRITFLGDGFYILSLFSACMASCLLKRYALEESPLVLSGWQLALGGLFLILLGSVTGGTLHPVGSSAWLMMLYLAFVSSAAYALWSSLLKYNPVSRIASCRFMIPISGVLLSALLLREPVTPMCLAALVLVALSIFTANRA